MTISVLQQRATDTSASVSSLALAFSSNLTVGSSVHACGSCSGSGTTGTSIACSDNVNGAYTVLDDMVATDDSQRVDHYKFDNVAGGATTVTVTPHAASTFVGIAFKEIGFTSGSDAGKHSAAYQKNPGTTTDIIKAGSVTPAVQPGLMSAFSVDTANVETTLTHGTGFAGDLTGSQWPNVGCVYGENTRYTSLSAINASFTDATNGATHHYTSLAAFFVEASLVLQPWQLQGQIGVQMVS